MAHDSSQAQIEGLATLLVLDNEIKKITNLREFGFFSTNETHRLIAYHTAYLWQSKEFIGTHLIAQSGTAEIDINAPMTRGVINQINTLRESTKAKEIHQIEIQDFNNTSKHGSSPNLLWEDTLPEYLLWCPLLGKSNDLTGGLLFFRDRSFSDSEINMLRWLIASYQFTWSSIVKPKLVPTWQIFKEKPYFIGLTITLLMILLFPIHISVLGIGTVIPKTPILINAPMQGVIKTFAVQPGETVKPGQLLVTLDNTDLQATAEVNQKDMLLTEAKLRTAINEGFSNKETTSHTEIPIIKAQLEIDKAHLSYTNTLLEKTNIVSPTHGIAVFEGKEDWLGQPVQTGERILYIANPQSVSLKIVIPVSDMIKLDIGDIGDFFLYGQLLSIPVRISTLGYNAKLMPNRILSYQLTANFVRSADFPQLGSQGTVRLYGPRVPLIYYLLRKPLQALRQTFGI